jgi:predicted ester cyclase
MSAEANKSIVLSFIEAWNTKDFDRFDSLMAEDAQLTVGGSTISCSPAETRAIAEYWIAGFPDYRFEPIHLVAEGDMVAALMPFSGTHLGPVLDLVPTGRKVFVSEMVFFRIVDGRIAEAWEDWDEYGMRSQLAADPPAP